MNMWDYQDYFYATKHITNECKSLTKPRSQINPKKMPGPEIKSVIFNPPATIVFWSDGTKTVVKCYEEDYFSEECGLAMAICKKVYGNDNTFHKVFKKYIKEPEEVDTDTFNNYLRRFKEAFSLPGGFFDN